MFLVLTTVLSMLAELAVDATCHYCVIQDYKVFLYRFANTTEVNVGVLDGAIVVQWLPCAC